jgi:IS4 transposase
MPTLNPMLERFVKSSPITVMTGGIAARMLHPEQLDAWFEGTEHGQYTRELLFSTVFDIMSQVVCSIRPSVNAACQAMAEEIPTSITSVYNKLQGVEVETSAGLVRFAASEAEPLIGQLGGTRPALLPGLRMKILDGNCIAASEHRIKELRAIKAGALPGKSLVVLDPALRLPIDVFPCEDGHAQERSLLDAVLESVEQGDCWMADRNFCTAAFLHGIAERGAFFIIRRHGNLSYHPVGKMTRVGQSETGTVYEQYIEVPGESGETKNFRLIKVVLTEPTRDGDSELYIVTNVGKRKANGIKIAELYRQRWRIETAFQDLTEHLNSEINTLGYPKAALFGFCVALVVYMMHAVIKAALSNVHGSETVDATVSGYYVADEISATYRGMMIAIPPDEWRIFVDMRRAEFVKILVRLATSVNLRKFRKHPRGPKKKNTKRKYDAKHPHVSTARLIAKRNQ